MRQCIIIYNSLLAQSSDITTTAIKEWFLATLSILAPVKELKLKINTCQLETKTEFKPCLFKAKIEKIHLLDKAMNLKWF